MTVPVPGFWCEEFGVIHFHNFTVFEISSTQEKGHWSKQITNWRCKVRAVCWVWYQIPHNSWIFVIVVRAVWGFALTGCKRTLFLLTKCWVYPSQTFINSSQLFRIKILDCTPVWKNCKWITHSKFRHYFGADRLLLSSRIRSQGSIAIVKKFDFVFYCFRFYITPTF